MKFIKFASSDYLINCFYQDTSISLNMEMFEIRPQPKLIASKAIVHSKKKNFIVSFKIYHDSEILLIMLMTFDGFFFFSLKIQEVIYNELQDIIIGDYIFHINSNTSVIFKTGHNLSQIKKAKIKLLKHNEDELIYMTIIRHGIYVNNISLLHSTMRVRFYKISNVIVKDIINFEILDDFTGENYSILCKSLYDSNEKNIICLQKFYIPNLENQVIVCHHVFFVKCDFKYNRIARINGDLFIFYIKFDSKWLLQVDENFKIKNETELNEMKNARIDHVDIKNGIDWAYLLVFVSNSAFFVYKIEKNGQISLFGETIYRSDTCIVDTVKCSLDKTRREIKILNTYYNNTSKIIIFSFLEWKILSQSQFQMRSITKTKHIEKKYMINSGEVTLEDGMKKNIRQFIYVKTMKNRHCVLWRYPLALTMNNILHEINLPEKYTMEPLKVLFFLNQFDLFLFQATLNAISVHVLYDYHNKKILVEHISNMIDYILINDSLFLAFDACLYGINLEKKEISCQLKLDKNVVLMINDARENCLILVHCLGYDVIDISHMNYCNSIKIQEDFFKSFLRCTNKKKSTYETYSAYADELGNLYVLLFLRDTFSNFPLNIYFPNPPQVIRLSQGYLLSQYQNTVHFYKCEFSQSNCSFNSKLEFSYSGFPNNLQTVDIYQMKEYSIFAFCDENKKVQQMIFWNKPENIQVKFSNENENLFSSLNSVYQVSALPNAHGLILSEQPINTLLNENDSIIEFYDKTIQDIKCFFNNYICRSIIDRVEGKQIFQMHSMTDFKRFFVNIIFEANIHIIDFQVECIRGNLLFLCIVILDEIKKDAYLLSFLLENSYEKNRKIVGIESDLRCKTPSNIHIFVSQADFIDYALIVERVEKINHLTSYIRFICEIRILVLISKYGEIQFSHFDEYGNHNTFYEFTYSSHLIEISNLRSQYDSIEDLDSIFLQDQSLNFLESYTLFDIIVFSNQSEYVDILLEVTYLLFLFNFGAIIFQHQVDRYTDYSQMKFHTQISYPRIIQTCEIIRHSASSILLHGEELTSQVVYYELLLHNNKFILKS